MGAPTASRLLPAAVLLVGLGLAIAAGVLGGDGWLVTGVAMVALLLAGVLHAGLPPRTGRIRMDLWLAWVLAGSVALLLAYWATPSEGVQVAVLAILILAAYLAIPRIITRPQPANEPQLVSRPQWRPWLPWLGLLVIAWLAGYLWELAGDSAEYLSIFLGLIAPAVWLLGNYGPAGTWDDQTGATQDTAVGGIQHPP